MMLLAVTGNPIAHSASPDLHRAGMQAAGMNGTSLRLIADSADEALQLAIELGVRGLNVTAPFKEQMATLLDELSSEATSLGAVNTVLFNSNRLSGFNTDVFGVKESLRPRIQELKIGSNAVVLGAGGAAKAACMALRDLNFGITILNRSKFRAENIAKSFEAQFYGYDDIEHEQSILNADIIINCLSTLECPFKSTLLNNKHIVLDANYKKESIVTKEARLRGSTIISGLDWLINQSRESQAIFYGSMPEFSKLKDSIKHQDKKSIALIGLMGSGKSEVGSGLAAKLGLSCTDLDAQIEKSQAKSIKEIFEQQGEDSFRKLENENLTSLDVGLPHVLSCGGGIVLNPQNRDFLTRNYQVIWLWASPQSLIARIKDSSSRPLLQHANVEQRLQELLVQRKEFYAYSSDLVIKTDMRTKNQVIQRIYEEVADV